MHLLKRIFFFYVNGFKRMDKLGIKLWTIILVKLFIMFAVLKIFFFKNFLNTEFDTEEDKIEYVTKSLTNKH